MKRKLFFWPLLLAATLLAGCGKDKTETPPPAIRIVKAVTVGSAAAGETRDFSGDVRARHETLAGFRVGGKIAERLVEVGAQVKPGQALARLDVADLALRAREAEAQRALAAADARRYRDLRAQNFVSQAAVDSRDTAQQAADAQAALARNQAGYASLMADRAGVVAEVLAEPGQVVAAGQGVFRLAWDGEREIEIALPEDAVGSLKPGAEAEVSLWAAPDKRYRGRLRELAPVADAATRSYRARVTVLDAAALPLGMSATVSFKLAARQQTLLPLAALFQQGDAVAVWVIAQDGTVALRPVKIAAYTDQGARLESGLEAGERIVAAGVHKLHAGEKVRVADSK